MFNVLVVSNSFQGFGLALKLDDSDARIFYYNPSIVSNIGKGFLNPSVITFLTPSIIDKLDIAIFVDSGNGQLAESLKENKIFVFNGGTVQDILNSQHSFKIKLIDSLPYLQTINPIDNNYIPLIIEGWFNGNEFVEPLFNMTLMKTRYGVWDKGAVVGNMGALNWSVKNSNKIIKQVMLPMTQFLKEVEYIGIIKMNLSVSEKTLYYNDMSTDLLNLPVFSSKFEQSILQIMWNLFNKNKNFSLKKGYDGSLTLNYDLLLPNQDILLMNNCKKHVWPVDIMLNSEQKEVTAGESKVLAYIMAGGNSVNMVKNRIYSTIDNIVKTEDIYYRIDIFDYMEDDINWLKQWKWI
jgi:hypothetical protein